MDNMSDEAVVDIEEFGGDIEVAELDLVASEVDLITGLSSLLFVSTRPMTVDKLVALLKCNEDQLMLTLDDLKLTLETAKLGFELVNVGGAYQLRTTAEVKSTIQKLVTPKMRRLSKAAAETLAVVAYKQPVTRAEIEAIRGVDALPTLKTLLDGSLIRIIGREDSAGSPALYGTTDKFLERFGLSNLSDLPTIREVTELASEASEEDVDNDDESLEEDLREEVLDSLETLSEEEYVNN